MFVQRLADLRHELDLTIQESELLLDVCIEHVVAARQYILSNSLNPASPDDIKQAYEDLDTPTLEDIAYGIFENRGHLDLSRYFDLEAETEQHLQEQQLMEKVQNHSVRNYLVFGCTSISIILLGLWLAYPVLFLTMFTLRSLLAISIFVAITTVTSLVIYWLSNR